MRTHTEIVAAAGKAEEVAARRRVSVHTVRSWAQRDSIPAEHWRGFADEGCATLEELAGAAAARREPAPVDPEPATPFKSPFGGSPTDKAEAA